MVRVTGDIGHRCRAKIGPPLLRDPRTFAREGLARALGTLNDDHRETRILLRGSQPFSYRHQMETMDLFEDGGFPRIALGGLVIFAAVRHVVSKQASREQ